MTAPVAGWYADPNGGSGLRFWNGAGWTDSTQALPVLGPTAPPAASQYPNRNHATGPYPAQGPQYHAQPFVVAPRQPPPPAPSRNAQASAGAFLAANKFALITVVICAVYAIIAAESHYMLFGILPVLMTARSFRAREALWLIALVAAVASVVYSLYRLNHG